jgi:transketolase
MRISFIKTLCELARTDENIWLVCGDLGFSVLEPFAEEFPDRFINAGVAEQNMTGLAAGLALSGKTVFTYSIANFPVMRCFEQIRNDVCYHNLNVKIVAVGGGLAYGTQGYTHHGVEDLAVMRVLPNMTVIAPGDPIETKFAVQSMAQQKGPGYLRLGKASEPIVHQTEPVFEIGRAIRLLDGKDIALISTGAMLETTMAAAKELQKTGVAVTVLSMHTVQPLDENAVKDAAKECRAIITIEEHAVGGLGSAVGEILAQSYDNPMFRMMRLNREPVKHAGSQKYLRTAQGLDVKGIIKMVESVLARHA